MNVPFLDLKAQYQTLRPEMDAAILGVVESCQFAGGPAVAELEQAFAKYCNAEHCVAVSNGTSALEMLLRAFGVEPGDEVILPANTFFATAEAGMIYGVTPVLVDCEESTGLMDPTLVERAITKKTKVLIPVHLFGQPADMDAFRAIADKHKLILMEDSAQAHGATYKGKRTGSLADGAGFSFYPGKNLGAYGEAGAITTKHPKVAEQVRMLRDHGMAVKYKHEIVGRNDRMDTIQAAVLLTKLKKLDEWNTKRRAHAARYRTMLDGVTGVTIIQEKTGHEGVYHLFVIRVQDRDGVKQKLQDAGIGTGIHYPIPLHLQPACAGLGYKKGDFPVSERLADEILSLPMFPEMTEAQQDAVVDALKKAI